MLAPIKVSFFSQGISEKASKVRPPRPSMERGGCGELLVLYYSLLIARKAKRGKQQEKKAISYF